MRPRNTSWSPVKCLLLLEVSRYHASAAQQSVSRAWTSSLFPHSVARSRPSPCPVVSLSRVTELRPRTPAQHLEEFFALWRAQPRFALALHTLSHDELSAAAAGLAAGPPPTVASGRRPGSAGVPPTQRLQGLAVCWDLRQSFFLELTGAVGVRSLHRRVHACLAAGPAWLLHSQPASPAPPAHPASPARPVAAAAHAAAHCERVLRSRGAPGGGNGATVLDAVRAVLAQATQKVCYGALELLPELMQQG